MSRWVNVHIHVYLVALVNYLCLLPPHLHVQVLKMSQLLELTCSSYHPAYRSMMDTVTAALEEAREIRCAEYQVKYILQTFFCVHVRTRTCTSFLTRFSMYLKPLRHQFEEMEEADYLELDRYFPPLFHTLCLVWAHSQHYRQPAQLIVLMQEIANLLIELVREGCGGSEGRGGEEIGMAFTASFLLSHVRLVAMCRRRY